MTTGGDDKTGVPMGQWFESTRGSRTYEYLLEGIAWSRTWEEFDRLEHFARAHYTGRPLDDILAAIDQRRSALNVPGSWADDREEPEALLDEL